jgi:hypothetical protein
MSVGTNGGRAACARTLTLVAHIGGSHWWFTLVVHTGGFLRCVGDRAALPLRTDLCRTHWMRFSFAQTPIALQTNTTIWIMPCLAGPPTIMAPSPPGGADFECRASHTGSVAACPDRDAVKPATLRSEAKFATHAKKSLPARAPPCRRRTGAGAGLGAWRRACYNHR